MEDQNSLLNDMKEMLLGLGLMLFALGIAVFGYFWFQGTSGFSVCFYGGVILLIAGALCTWNGWSRHRSRKPPFPPGQTTTTKEEP